MKFNHFIWDLYKEAARGKWALARYARFSDAFSDASFLYGLLGMSLDFETLTDEERFIDEGITQEIKAAQDYAAKFNIKSPEQALKAYEKMIKAGLAIPAQDGSGEPLPGVIP